MDGVAETDGAAGAARFAVPPVRAAFTSRSTIRPWGPEPTIDDRSRPASFAIRLASGEAKSLAPDDTGAAAADTIGAGATLTDGGIATDAFGVDDGEALPDATFDTSSPSDAMRAIT